MATIKNKSNELKPKDEYQPVFIFEKKNYTVMFIGMAVIVLGFVLMIGGGSDDPEVFNPEMFSWRRIRLAPLLVVVGFGIEVYAILLNPFRSK